MQYILSSEGYLEQISFGATVKYDDKESIPYTGNIPDGYDSIEEWFDESTANESLNAWKIVDNNLVFDENKYNELIIKYEEETKQNSSATLQYVNETISKTAELIVDEFSTNATDSSLAVINDSGAYNIPKVELTGEVNEDITVIASNKNILGNKGVTSTINGVTFSIGENKSITLNGTATSNIEFTLDGSNTNTKMLFLIKKNKNYVVSGLTSNVTLNLYNFNGSSRTLVNSGTNESIYLNDTNIITQTTLNIASGKTFSNTTIYPQIEISDVSSSYEKHLENKIIVPPGENITIENELNSYNPTTIIMIDKEMAVSVDYYKYKSINNLSSKIEVLDDKITTSVSSITTLSNKIDSVNTLANNVNAKVDNLEIGGRNLCRGTKDFNSDTSRISGFKIASSNMSVSFDEENFGVISVSATGRTSNIIDSAYSSFIDFSTVREKEVIISFEFKVDDVTAWDHKYPFILEYYNSSGTRIGYRDVSMTSTKMNINTLESSVWYKLSYKEKLNTGAVTMTSGNTLDNVRYMGARLTLFRNGSVHFKKLKIELGNIDTDWTPAPEDVDGTVSDSVATSNKNLTDYVDNKVDGINTTIDNNYKDIVEKLDGYATNEEVTTIKKQVETISTDSQYAVTISKEIQTNGVSKVKTSTGFTFDETGLTIDKTGSTTKTNINEDGMVVYSTSGTETKMLEANSVGVIAENLTSKKYFVCGNKSRFEDYSDGTGCFYLG